MKFTIWRISPDGEAFPITGAGETSDREKAINKARAYMEKLRTSEPENADRYVVLDEHKKEIAVR